MTNKFRHRVEVDGEVVWHKSFDDASTKNFPVEYRHRPADGDPAHWLYINDEIVGVQISQAEEAAQAKEVQP